MKRLLLLILALNASVVYAQKLPDVSAFSQQQIFENWVQNRCISKIADSKSLKDDAEASAAAWLKQAILLLKILKKLTR
jgi:hypothetical protein